MCSCVNVEFHAYQAQLFKSRPVTAPPSAFTDVPNVTPPVLSLSPFAVPAYYQEDNTNPPSARALASRFSTSSSSDSDAGGLAATPARYFSQTCLRICPHSFICANASDDCRRVFPVEPDSPAHIAQAWGFNTSVRGRYLPKCQHAGRRT